MQESAAVVSPALSAGSMVEHYKVVRLLGQGGMGEVYLARDTRLGRKVALKVVRSEGLANEQARERFLREAQLTARFSHPHIVTVYGVGEHQGRAYLALEFLEGDTLRDRMSQGRFGVQETMRLGLAMAQALAEAHAHGVLHRDLKPENVIVARDGRLRVLDFGLAHSLEEPAEVTETAGLDAALDTTDTGAIFRTRGGVAGTPRYMAPEQWLGEEHTAATDVWALGVVLHELLTGAVPYEEGKIFALGARVCATDPVPDMAPAVSMPAELRALVGRCLLKDASTRPTATEAARVLEELLARDRSRLAPEASPFQGLMPFTEERANVFFGRDDEVAAFVERLRTIPVLPVVGPSGAGKSSFVQAGVVPALREQGRWLVLNLRPGARPFEALAAALGRGRWASTPGSTPESTPRSERAAPQAASPDEREASVESHTSPASKQEPAVLAAALALTPGRLALALHELAEREGAKVLLFVDQLEEIHTLVDDEEVTRKFLEAVCAAADDPASPVRVVLTLRDDFLGRTASIPLAREVLGHTMVLRSPGPEALRLCATRPLELAGYRYDDRSLPDEMVAAVADEPACLPLIQFACSELWRSRDTDRRLVLRASYETIGGVAGALARHADGLLEALSSEQIRTARQILLRLVTAEGTRQVLGRRAVLEGLPTDGSEILDRLVRERILVARKGKDAAASEVEIVHESLLRTWTRLSRWLEESREEVAFLAELGRTAELWDSRGRRDAEIWQADALREATAKAARIESLPSLARAFLDAGLAREARAKRRRNAVVGLVIAMLAAVSLVLVVMNRRANEQRRLAEQRKVEADQSRAESEQRRSDALLEVARGGLDSKRLLEARARIRAALEIRNSLEGRALWREAERDPLAWSLDLGTDTWSATLSPNGEVVAVGGTDGSVFLVDSVTAEVRVLRGHDAPVRAVAWSRDGSELASGADDGVLIVWSPTGDEMARHNGPESASIRRLAWAPNDQTIWWVGRGLPVLMRWSRSTGEQAEFRICPETCVGIAASPDGKWLATGAGNDVVLFDIEHGQIAKELVGHRGQVTAVAFRDDSQAVASASLDDLTVRLWQGPAWHEARRLEGERVYYPGALAFSHDGRRLAAGTYEGAVRLRDLGTGKVAAAYTPVDVVATHIVSGLAFGPNDETFVVSQSYGRTVALLRPARLMAETARGRRSRRDMLGATVSPDGTLVAVAAPGTESAAALLDLHSGALVRPLDAPGHRPYSLGFNASGSLAASPFPDGPIAVWEVSTGAQKHLLPGHEGGALALAFHPTEDLLASAGLDGRVRLWHPGTGSVVRELPIDRSAHYAIAFSPDGALLATAGESGIIQLFDTRSWQERRSFRVPERLRGLAFSPNGEVLASNSGEGTLRLWRLTTGESRLFGPRTTSMFPLAFHPDGRRIGVAGSGGVARIVPIDGGPVIELVGHAGKADVNTLRFSPDGRLAITASDDGTVRTWDADTGRPFWRAPLIIPGSLRLFSQRGWEVLSQTDATADPSKARWEKAVEAHARLGSATDDGSLVCLGTHEGHLELWSTAEDRLLVDLGLGSVTQLVAVPEGCVALAEGKALLVDHTAARRELALDASAVAYSRGRILIASKDKLLGLDAQGPTTKPPAAAGTDTCSWGIGSNAALAAFAGPWLVLGRTDGTLEIYPGAPGAAAAGAATSPPRLARASSTRVVQLLEGPAGTLLVGYADGVIALYSIESGTKLEQWRVHGSAIHLVLRGSELYAASDLGDSLHEDLSTYTRDYCDLMREVWREVPIEWEGGHAVLHPAPADHPCAQK